MPRRQAARIIWAAPLGWALPLSSTRSFLKKKTDPPLNLDGNAVLRLFLLQQLNRQQVDSTCPQTRNC